MPLTLLLLPIVFFVCADAAGLSLEDCRARGLVPYPRGSSGIGEIWQIVDYHDVQWGMLPRQIANLIGLIIIATTNAVVSNLFDFFTPEKRSEL